MLQRLKNIFWHPAITFFFALVNGFPASHMTVIGVTGTKGKSSVTEMLYAVCTAAGYQTALINGIRFTYPGHDEPNRFKMTMPGRGFVQRFLGKARRAGATHAIVEITSEGAVQSRHRFLALNGLIVTNMHHEHIEAHGSFERYVAAKKHIVAALGASPKKNTVLVVNGDDRITRTFLEGTATTEVTFSGAATPGAFHEANMRAAITLATQFGIDQRTAENAVAAMPPIQGRVEHIACGQNFDVVVDYAHTPDSLTALYDAFKDQKKLCVLGNTGGGRDTWKRPVMGAIADAMCDTVILTNEDPYDEDPRRIVEDMVVDMKHEPLVIMDRREAIAAALAQARPGDVVLISGKGTDPYIMEADGVRTPWSDAAVAREELEKLRQKTV